MKIIVFGTGRFYKNRKDQIKPNFIIIAFLDNDQSLQGKDIEGIPVVSPYRINSFSYDKILLMSSRDNAIEMRKQLIELGISAENIWSWEQFCSEKVRGKFKFYCGHKFIMERAKKILILSTVLDYNGGSFAAVYAARALQERGYNVVVTAAAGDQKFIEEIVENGLNVIICPALPYFHEEENFLIRQFDVVLVNVFQMIKCACDISKIKPVLWWIHEPSSVYENIIDQFHEYAYEEYFSNVNIYAVSDIPRKNFNHYFPDRISETLEYGIPDENKAGHFLKRNGQKMIFAIVGGICLRKAQDIFIQAVKLLNGEEKQKAEFWIIGAMIENDYSIKIKELASEEPSIKIMGLLTREELNKIYPEIDVVVCPSLEDPLPIVMTECMMYGKVCIVSDATGTVDYIEDGKNGFICKKGDAIGLCQKMRWVINHKERLQEIGFNARQTYETHFTLEKFGERLEKALLNTIDRYGR